LTSEELGEPDLGALQSAEAHQSINQITAYFNTLKFSKTQTDTCQLSRFSRELPSFSLNLPVIFGGYSWSFSLMKFSKCKDF